MCRHLAYLGPPSRLAELVLDPPHALLRQSWAPRRHARRRHRSTPTASGSAGTAGRRRWPVRATGAACRSGPTPSLPDAGRGGSAPARCSPRSAPPPSACRSARRRAAPFADGRWLFSHNGRVDGWPGSVAGSPPTLPRPDLLTAGRADRRGAAVGAGARTGCGRRDAPRRRCVRGHRRSPPAAPGPGSTCCSPTASRVVGHHAWTHALSVPADRAAVVRRLRAARRRPGWRRGPRPHPARRHADRRAPSPRLPTDDGHCPTIEAVRSTSDLLTRPTPTTALRADARAGLTATPEVAAAQVVLRRPRQRAVRGDHPAARVLPDPRRAGDPRRARRRDRRRAPARRPWSSSARAPRRRPGCCSTRCAARARCSAFVPLDVSRDRPARGGRAAIARGLPGAASARRRRRLHRAPRAPAGAAGTGWSRSSAARSATSCPDERAEFLAALPGVLEPGEQLLLGTDLVKDAATCWCRPTTTRPG